MDFSWTEEHKIFRETVRDFAQKEIKPIVREMDTKGEIPPKIIKGMADLGLMGMTVDEQYGGIGPNFTMACIAAEELGRADISIAIPVLFLVTAAWGNVFNLHGTKQAKDELLPKVTRGEWILGIATTEPGGGSDIVGMHTTKLEKKGDHYVMNGEKVYISGVRESLKYGGYHMTLGWTDKSAGHKGLTFALVSLKDTPGVEPTFFEDMGRMGISTGGFSMKDVKIPSHHIVGEVNRGFYYAMEGFSCARVIIGATCLGAAQAGLEIGMDYIKERKAFGQPIGKFEGVQFPLADAYARLQADRLLTYRAAWMMDQMYEKKTFTHHEVALACAMVKLRTPTNTFNTLNMVTDWLGAFGYTKECPVEMGVRGVRSYSVGAEGTPNIMRLIIARELLGKEFLPYR